MFLEYAMTGGNGYIGGRRPAWNHSTPPASNLDRIPHP